MGNDLRIKRKVKGIRYFAATCMLMLSLMVKAKKGNALNIQQTVPVNSEASHCSKKFASVEIMQGDTLWSIAENNKTGNYTTKELVEEIKNTNGLNGDKIIVGKYLIVPYYD